MKNYLVTQTKNEAKRLENWMAYHQSQGFDGVIFFDDFSSDETQTTLDQIESKYKFEIIRLETDGLGGIHNTGNSNIYGTDSSFHYRLVRSYNKGIEIAKSKSSDALCAIIDVDEFLVSNENCPLVEVMRGMMKEKCVSQLYIQSLDVNDNFTFDDWVTNQLVTTKRWDYAERNKTKFRTRGKSVVFANSAGIIPEINNSVHVLSSTNMPEDSPMFVKDYNNLRIHHFRKPIMDKDIPLVEDFILYEKCKGLKK